MAKKHRLPVVGDKVTCKYPVEAYGSSYKPFRDNRIFFEPGMVAEVKAIPPKVHPLHKGVKLPFLDRKPDFLFCTYTNPKTGEEERVGLHFCNAEIVEES